MLPPFCRTKKKWRRSSFDIGTAEWHQDDSRASLYLTSFRVQSTNGVDPESTMASWMDNAETFPPSRSLRKGEFVGKILQNRVYRECIGNILSRWWLALFGWNFHPENWGRGTHCDEHIFQRGLVQPPTSYITILEPENAWVSKFGKFKGLIFRRSIPGTSGVHEPFV